MWIWLFGDGLKKIFGHKKSPVSEANFKFVYQLLVSAVISFRLVV